MDKNVPAKKPEYLTLFEAAKIARTSVKTLRRRIKQGDLKADFPAGRWLVRPIDLRRFIKTNIRRNPGPR